MIGVERELKHKPLGLKTCMVIAVSSCLLTIVSIESAETFSEISSNIRTDSYATSSTSRFRDWFYWSRRYLKKKQ
nr:MgtC/SapB family protein [Bacillus sp. RAR_GA_16]